MSDPRARLLHALMHRQTAGALATLHKGRPAVSMAPFAVSPVSRSIVIHVSSLATHTRDMEAAPEVAFLVVAPPAPDILPQALPRISITGTATRCPPGATEYSAARTAYLARFPESEPLFGFGDFSLFLIEPAAARAIAGFGEAWSVTRTQYLQWMSAPQ